MKRLKSQGLWRSLAALWTLAVFVACALPGSALRDIAILSADKFYHLVAFLVFALLWRLARVRPLVVAVSGVGFALFIEWWQANVAIGRYADPYDALADGVGLALGLWAFRVACATWEERAARQRPDAVEA